MRFLLVSAVAMFSFLAINAQEETDCIDYKTGTFMVEGDTETVIERGEFYQKEDRNGVIARDTVEWISDCEYKLIPLLPDSDKIKPGGIVLNCEIIETGFDFYTIVMSTEWSNQTKQITLYKK